VAKSLGHTAVSLRRVFAEVGGWIRLVLWHIEAMMIVTVVSSISCLQTDGAAAVA